MAAGLASCPYEVHDRRPGLPELRSSRNVWPGDGYEARPFDSGRYLLAQGDWHDNVVARMDDQRRNLDMRQQRTDVDR